MNGEIPHDHANGYLKIFVDSALSQEILKKDELETNAKLAWTAIGLSRLFDTINIKDDNKIYSETEKTIIYLGKLLTTRESNLKNFFDRHDLTLDERKVVEAFGATLIDDALHEVITEQEKQGEETIPNHHL